MSHFFFYLLYCQKPAQRISLDFFYTSFSFSVFMSVVDEYETGSFASCSTQIHQVCREMDIIFLLESLAPSICDWSPVRHTNEAASVTQRVHCPPREAFTAAQCSSSLHPASPSSTQTRLALCSETNTSKTTYAFIHFLLLWASWITSHNLW